MPDRLTITEARDLAARLGAAFGKNLAGGPQGELWAEYLCRQPSTIAKRAVAAIIESQTRMPALAEFLEVCRGLRGRDGTAEPIDLSEPLDYTHFELAMTEAEAYAAMTAALEEFRLARTALIAKDGRTRANQQRVAVTLARHRALSELHARKVDQRAGPRPVSRVDAEERLREMIRGSGLGRNLDDVLDQPDPPEVLVGGER